MARSRLLITNAATAMPQLIGIATLLALVVGPLLLGLAGFLNARRSPAAQGEPARRSTAKLAVASALLYTLAFNLTFFIQELFLVVPKALTPGLRPTLFHNNHRWDGEHPLAALFQGTGALATFVVAAACLVVLRRDVVRSPAWRLWLIWMAYCGFFMALPQVVVGALSAGSDLGMAMGYFQLGTTTKTAAALVALAAIPLLALMLLQSLLGLAAQAAVGSAGARTWFVCKIALFPMLVANLLIVLFRVPREWIEVIVVPAVVTLVGLGWLLAGAWRVRDAQPIGDAAAPSLAWPLGLVIVLLAIFQLLLRPGIAFY